jgi:TolB-like protein/tetratricopeptide (TPR) repeat protein
MDVLMQLATRAGAVAPVEELMTTVWKGVVVSDGSVYLAISQLRQALGDADSGASYIETVPKRGYRLTVPVEPFAIESGPVQVAVPSRRTRTGTWLAMAAVVAAIFGWLALSWRAPSAVADHSLAVLPFADLSPDGDQAYFADGITEEVLNRLAILSDLRVVGRASSFQLRGQGADPRALGEKLGVQHVLVGSVRKAGDRVRVTAQLSEARSGRQLWSQTYERRLDNIFVIQDEIAKAVAAAMQVKLGVGETALIPGMTRDVAAYDEYLRGLALNMVGRPESVAPAIAHLQRAVAIDPDFSMAWSALHAVLSNGAFFVPERAREWRRAASEALERARQLTPDAPHVLLALGIASMRSGNWLEGAELFQRLEQSQARYSPGEVAGPRGMLLLAAGRIREAIPVLEAARAHEPLAPAFAAALSRAYLVNGDYHGALAEIDRGLQLDGLHEVLLNAGFMTALNIGDRQEMDRRFVAITDDTPNARLHRRLVKFLGKPAGVAAEIRGLATAAISSEKATLAEWAAYYAEPALALELLTESMPRPGGPSMIWQPVFGATRALPGFETLVRSIGIADYWRVHGYADFCQPAGPRIQCR